MTIDIFQHLPLPPCHIKSLVQILKDGDAFGDEAFAWGSEGSKQCDKKNSLITSNCGFAPQKNGMFICIYIHS